METLGKVIAFIVIFILMVAFPPLGLLLTFLGLTSYFYRKG